jgi:hypothetical protein
MFNIFARFNDTYKSREESSLDDKREEAEAENKAFDRKKRKGQGLYRMHNRRAKG